MQIITSARTIYSQIGRTWQCVTMKTDPTVTESSIEKLSTLHEEAEYEVSKTTSFVTCEVEKSMNEEISKQELNNNINNNNRKPVFDSERSASVEPAAIRESDILELETERPCTPHRSQSAPATPQTDEWIGVGTWRRRRLSSDKVRSLKSGDEELGLEHVIPYHRSPKALSDMGKIALSSLIGLCTQWLHVNKN